MKRISLRTGPSGTCPYYILSIHFPGDVGHGLVVAQRVEVVFVPSALARSIEASQRSTFTEIDLDGSHAYLKKAGDLFLIPFHRLRIREVQNNILLRK